MTKNNPEAEINKIRLELYEETKNMTVDERINRVNKLAQDLAAQYGFTIGKPSSVTNASKAI